MPRLVNKKEITIHLDPYLLATLKSYRDLTRKGINDIITEFLGDYINREVVRFKKLQEKEKVRILKLQEKTQKNSLSD